MTIRKALNNLQPGTEYGIRMRAVNAAGVSQWSTRYVFTTTTDSELPETPTNVTWEAVGSSFIGTWTRVTQNEQGDTVPITRYDVRLQAGVMTKVVSVVQSADTFIDYHLSYEANRALFGTAQGEITMSVRAVDNKELKSAYSTPILATRPVPNPPTNVVAIGALNAINLTWTASTTEDVAGYNVYNASNTLLGFTAGTSFSYDTSTYSAQVLSVATVDKFGLESTKVAANSATPGSPFASDTTPPPVPTGLGAVLAEVDATSGRSTLSVNWAMASPPTDLSDIIIYYRPVGTTAWEVYTVPTNASPLVTSAIINNVVSSVNYEVKVSARDFQSNESATSSIVTATAPTNTAPPQPATPTASANTMQIQVTHTGNSSAGPAMPADVVEYEVHASTTTGFTADATNRLGKIRSGPSIVGTFAIPANAASGATQTWYVKVVAVDRGGLKSTASPQATAAVGLISTLNVADASITSAKITTLNVNQLEADSVLSKTINIGVGGVLNVDSTGVIKSSNWISEQTGYRLTNNSLEINDGSIQASALLLQNSNNMMHPPYAGFEYTDYYYTKASQHVRGQGNLAYSIGTFYGEEQVEAMYGTRVGAWNTGVTTSAGYVYFGKTLTDFNIEVEEGESYIISMWIRNRKTTGVALPLNMRLRTADNTNVKNESISLLADNTWYRYKFSTPYVPGANINRVLLGLEKTNTTLPVDVWIDGVQVERMEAGLAEPSPYKPPSRTTIEGGAISTGSIRSAGDTTVNGVVQPMWSINMTGAAQFGDASVRGKLIVGPEGGTENGASWIASGNYVLNTTGWKIDDLGYIEGSRIVSRASNGVRTEIANAYNPYEVEFWSMIQMFTGEEAGWTPAQIWAAYDDSESASSTLNIVAPAPTGPGSQAARLTMYAGDDNYTKATLSAEEVNFVGNTYGFGANNGNTLIFKQLYADTDGRWSFRGTTDKRIDLAFATAGENRIWSLTAAGAREFLNFMVGDMRISLGNASDNIEFGGAGSMNDIPIMYAPNHNAGIGFSGAQETRSINQSGGSLIPHRASSHPTASDARHKTNEKEVTNVLTKLNKLKVYDYDTPNGLPRKNSQRKKDKAGVQTFKQRGVMAQDLKKLWPDAVNEDDVDGLGYAVDTYYLLATAIAAIKELSTEVETLKKELKK
jgi:hypothetical protein